MPNYSFEKDLPIAVKTEHEIARLLQNLYKAKIKAFGRDKRFDILAEIKGKDWTFEIKEDFTSERTGNVGLEFSCRGKPSGIEASQADFYIYKIHSKFNGIQIYLFKTMTLKKMVANKVWFRIVNGGDVGSDSMNYLFKYEDFTRYGKKITPDKEGA